MSILPLVGFRRLYRATGIQLPGESLHFSTKSTDGFVIEFYLGPRPPYGRWTRGPLEFLSKDGPIRMGINFKPLAEGFKDVKNYLDLAVVRSNDLAPEWSAAFLAKDDTAATQISESLQRDRRRFAEVLDLVVGAVCLRFHCQLAMEELGEEPLMIRGPLDFGHSFAGSTIRVCDDLQFSAGAGDSVGNFVSEILNADSGSRKRGCEALSWMIRAWHARDSVLAFLSHFVVLEMMVEGETVDATQSMATAADSLRDVVIQSNNPELMVQLNAFIASWRPALAARFESLVKRCGAASAQQDLEAFKKFNKMRNDLLHRGNQMVRSTVTLSTQDVQSLEDLVERYLAFTLFGNMELAYQSRFGRGPQSVG